MLRSVVRQGLDDLRQPGTNTVTSKRIARDVLLRRLWLERSYRPPSLLRHPEWNFEPILKLAVAHQLRRRPDFTFLQVGAFDGLTGDPIHPLVREFGLRGIVVEPQVQLFDTLKANYADHPQVSLVNAAVAETNGTRDFYTAAQGPIYQASFSKSFLLKHRVPADQIVSLKVRSVTISSLLQEHGMHGCDLIQIDAEGYDYEIIRTVDFDAVKPLIIRFEHVHLTDDECDECITLLASRGFRFIGERRDIIALREP
jgi:FkbM family methyltransferase